MTQSHLEVAQSVIETSFRLRHHSIAGRAALRRDMDQSRKAIQASRDLLKRLRQHHREDVARGWEDADAAPIAVSAFDADIIRKVFHDLVLETGVPECQWRELATSLVHEFTGCERIEAGLVDWIIGGSYQPVWSR
ncbi:hypothetical protein NKH94_28110 [Mesorhizobium australicum]|uniref:hypothetical protein n=1 Tax=Mesorhizobium australicum TaxID=536018 RepID=UPI00333C4F5A